MADSAISKVTRIERGFPGIEQRGDREHLIVERAIEARAADAVQKTLRGIPGLGEKPVERLQRECAAILAIEHARRFEIRRDEHGVPADVERFIDGGRGPALAARGQQFRFGARQQAGRVRFAQFQLARNRFDRLRDP